MKTKYDWSGVPENIKYGVTDTLGRQLGLIEKPDSIDKYCVMWCDYFIDSNCVAYVGNWQDSLEERPK